MTRVRYKKKTDFISASLVKSAIYGVNLKVSQHENYDISEMREYFCANFCPVVYKTTVQ